LIAQVKDADQTARDAVAAGAKNRDSGERISFTASVAGASSILSVTSGSFGSQEDVEPEEIQRRADEWATQNPPAAASKPPGEFHNVVPSLWVDDAAKLIDFLKEAFGAEELVRSEEEGSIHYAEIKIEDATMELGDASDKYPPIQRAPSLCERCGRGLSARAAGRSHFDS